MNTMADKLDNKPNAEKLLESLRYLGYDNILAIGDIIDNAIDADAQEIRINVERKPDSSFVIQIADNGTGMAEYILDQASRLGSETPRSPSTDLGRFGMGLVTASLSMGRRLTIISRVAGSEMLANVTDIDHMVRANEFIKEYFGPARKEDAQLFRDLLSNSASGTVVQLSKTDGFTRKYTRAFEKELHRYIGQVYRMFIRAGRKFLVNGTEVPIHDPLWIEQKAEIFSDEIYNLKFTNVEGQEKEEPIRIRLIILPDQGSAHLNGKAGFNVLRSGLYILRNNREIAAAQLLGLNKLSRHPDFIRFRGEIFITGRLDEAFGIEFTKRDVKPTQSVLERRSPIL